jgi:polysaccharide chain length determinant protein (PEP-CTERM system associated)
MGDLDLRFYLSIFLRRLPYFLVIATFVTTAAVALALYLPPIFQASAKILVESPQIPADLARSTVPINAVEQLQIIEQQIMTRENVLALAEKLKIYGDKASEIPQADIIEDMRGRTKFELLQKDGPSGSLGAKVFSVSFIAGDADLAAKVVNEFTKLILQMNVRLRTDRAGETMQFFNQEVARLGGELSRLEAEILKFKNANKDALPDGLDFRRNQQNNQQERLQSLEREEAALRSRRNNLVELFESTGRIVSAGPVTLEQQMLQDLQRTLSEQLALFSENSPNIVALRARIKTLENGMQAKQASDADTTKGKRGTSELDLQLSDIDDRLKYITQEKASITENLAELTKSITATPRNETILNSLERNRENIQAQYNIATARSAEASTGEQIEVSAKGERFTVVEPAVAPQKPTSPNRRRIAGAGFAGGIGLGLGLIVLLELLNKSIRRPTELVRTLQIQPLATISYIPVKREKKTAKLAQAAGFAAFVATTATSAIPIDRQGHPAGLSTERTVSGFDGGRVI